MVRVWERTTKVLEGIEHQLKSKVVFAYLNGEERLLSALLINNEQTSGNQANQKKHRHALAAAITNLGGTPVMAESQYDLSSLKTPALITAGASIGSTESAYAAAIRVTFKALGVALEIVPSSFVSADNRNVWMLKV